METSITNPNSITEHRTLSLQTLVLQFHSMKLTKVQGFRVSPLLFGFIRVFC